MSWEGGRRVLSGSRHRFDTQRAYGRVAAWSRTRPKPSSCRSLIKITAKTCRTTCSGRSRENKEEENQKGWCSYSIDMAGEKKQARGRVKVKSAGSGGLRTLVEQDKRLSRLVYDRFYERVVPASLLELIEGLGSGKLWFPLAIAALIAARDNLPNAQIAANFIAGLTLDVVLVGGLKTVVKRKRPEYSRSKEYVPIINIDSFSMPSGHTSRSVYVAIFSSCVMFSQQDSRYAVGTALAGLLWSATTAASRVMLGRHYVSDVLVGTAVSFLNFLLLSKGTFSANGFLLDTNLTEQLVQKCLSLPSFR